MDPSAVSQSISSSPDEISIEALLSAVRIPSLHLTGEIISFSNEAANNIFGRDTLDNSRLSDLLPKTQPDGRSSPALLADLQRSVTLNNPQSITLTFQKTDGTFFPGECSIGVIPSSDGSYICTITDRSYEYAEMNRADTLSREMDAKRVWYEAIIDAIPFPISVTDPDMIWTYVNSAVETFKKTKREKY